MKRALLCIVALGCHAAPTAAPLDVQRTPLVEAGPVIAAVEQAGTLYLFAPERATIEHAGALVARIPAPDGAWAEAGTMPALDGEGTWVVARTAQGSLWRITTTGELEPIHDLLKLAPHARSLAAAGGVLGVALDTGVAVLQDRGHIDTFAAPQPGAIGEILATAGRVALRHGPVLDLWDLATRRQAQVTVPAAIAAGFTAPATGRARLVVATPDAVFIEAPAAPVGELHKLTAPAPIHRVAIAGGNVWLATGNGVFVVDAERGSLRRAAVEAAPGDRLLGLASGDALLATGASLTRLAVSRPAADPRWAAEVAPIYQRVCARCHAPGGDAGLDLSTADAWRAERKELIHRVLESRTMPPAGTAMSDADRAALAKWLH